MSKRTIPILWPWEIKKISGVAVVADVYAATTNLGTFIAKEAAEIFLVNKRSMRRAFELYPDAVLIGETIDPEEIQVLKDYGKEFYCSNYPTAIEKVSLVGKTVLFISHNGSKVIELAFENGAQEVYTVAYTYFESVWKYLSGRDASNLTFIASGEKTEPAISDLKSLEDYRILEDLRKKLTSVNVNLSESVAFMNTFIQSHYPSLGGQRAKMLKIISHINSIQAVPVCRQPSNGLIEIQDIR